MLTNGIGHARSGRAQRLLQASEFCSATFAAEDDLAI
jgi:hypothetical protein